MSLCLDLYWFVIAFGCGCGFELVYDWILIGNLLIWHLWIWKEFSLDLSFDNWNLFVIVFSN